VGSKRRRDSDDDDSEDVDETGRLVGSVAKRSRLVTEVASASEEQGPLPPPSPSPSPRENTPEPSATKEVVEALPIVDTVEKEASSETAKPTDATDSNNEAIVTEELVQQEDNGKVDDNSSLAEATSPNAEDDVPSSSSEETASTTIVRESSPTPITQIPVLTESTTPSNIEAPEVHIIIEARGTIASDVPTAALNLSSPVPIEVK